MSDLTIKIITIASAFLGSAIGGSIIAGIIGGIFKGSTIKLMNKIDVEKISNKAVDKGVEKIKKVSFEQSIQPIVESELKKVNEYANAYVKDVCREMQVKLDSIINILEKQARYFDDSIGVSDNAKADLKKAIEDAKSIEFVPQEIVVEEVKEEEPIKIVKKSVNVER